MRTWQAAYAHVFVADEGDAVVGFVSVAPGELFALYAAPEGWGTGAGTALTHEAKRWLAAHGEEAGPAVFEDNPRARRFYEREGWHADGETKEDELVGVTVREVLYRIRLD